MSRQLSNEYMCVRFTPVREDGVAGRSVLSDPTDIILPGKLLVVMIRTMCSRLLSKGLFELYC